MISQNVTDLSKPEDAISAWKKLENKSPIVNLMLFSLE